MTWLNKLERKFGKYYIANLMLIITMGSAACYLFSMINPQIITLFSLDPAKILQGQIWRLITFVFVTPSSSALYIFTIYFYYIAGSSLEHEWGEFKFNVYYFVGILSTIIVAFISYFLLSAGISLTITSLSNYYSNIYLAATLMNLSLFLGYAKLYPEREVLLFFLIPVKIKWLGYLNWAIIILNFVSGLINLDITGILFTIVPIVNYLLFFAKSNYREKKMRANSVIRMKDYKKKINSAKKPYLHKCEECGITNEQDPDMEFRYCSKCVGKHCYCEKHILNHKHKI